jgi:CRISPR-associated exonuclease Cas4
MDHFLPLAWVAEYLYCQRASFYFLTGSENGEEENVFIQRGRGVHMHADLPGKRYRGSFKEHTAVYIRSFEHKLTGKADLIREYDTHIIPVEYKSGDWKESEFHKFQLGLQALCISEQMKKPVPAGFVYFYQVNKLQEYSFDEPYLQTAIETVRELHTKLHTHDINLFKKVNLPSCVHCSFFDICLPEIPR